MSTPYPGDGTIPSPTVAGNARKAITSSTDATPIVMHTIAHGFNTGDTVEQEGHLTNTNANGVFTIVVVDADHYALNGSTATGGGAGGATGYAIDYQVLPAPAIADDGELIDNGTIAPPQENARDCVPFIYRRLGRYREFGPWLYGQDDAGTWLNFTTSVTSSFQPAITLTTQFGTPRPAVKGGDILLCTWTMQLLAVANVIPISLGISITGTGAGGVVKIPNSGQTLASSYVGPLTLQGAYVVPAGAPDIGNAFEFYLLVHGNGGGTVNLQATADHQLIIRHLRPN